MIRESDYTPEEYKKLLRKIDRFLLPLMWFCYGIQQTDKTSLGTQAIFGLRTDTNLHGQQYSWLTTIFYITYMCGEFPSNFLLQRWNLGLVRILMAAAVVCARHALRSTVWPPGCNVHHRKLPIDRHGPETVSSTYMGPRHLLTLPPLFSSL